jgi:hypothetical protein
MKNLVCCFIVLSFVIIMSSSNSLSAMNQKHVQEKILALTKMINDRPGNRINRLTIIHIMYGGAIMILVCVKCVSENLSKVKSKFCKSTSLCEC